MKKILFFAAIAAVALTSCSKSESVNQPTGKAIGFDQAYIGKPVKGVPVTGTAFAEGATMAVYSTKDGAADMNGTIVTKAGAAWTYSPTMFYVKDVKYIFAAYAPVAPAGASMTAVTDYVVDADITKQVDLMYAPATAEVSWDGLAATVMDPIQFSFKHALSQVKFSAKAAGDYSSMYKVDITGLTIKQVTSNGTLIMTTNAWTEATTPAKADYVQPVAAFTLGTTMAPIAHAANHVLMLRPQTWATELEVEIAVTVTATAAGDAVVAGKVKTITAKIPAGTWERNKIYNYQMTLDLATILELKEITFGEPSIEDWVAETPNPELPVNPPIVP